MLKAILDLLSAILSLAEKALLLTNKRIVTALAVPIAILIVIICLAKFLQQVDSFHVDSSGTGAVAAVTDAEVQVALTRLVTAVQRGENDAKEPKITAGLQPFFVRIPKERLAVAELSRLQNEVQRVIDNDQPGTKVTDLVYVTIFGDSELTRLKGVSVKVEIEVEKTDVMGNKLKVREWGVCPFRAPDFFTNRETKEWADEFTLQEELFIPVGKRNR